jgi:hypothetical protein
MGPRWRLAVLTGLFALVTACGGGGEGGDDGVASLSEKNTPSSNEPAAENDVDQMRAFAKCMREHGIDMPDPEVSKDGGVGIAVPAVPGNGDMGKVEKAHTACQKFLPNGGEPEKPTAEDLDAMRKQAKCLRDHGIDVPDPTMEDPGLRIGGTPDQEKFKKAMEECGNGKGMIAVGGGGK